MKAIKSTPPRGSLRNVQLLDKAWWVPAAAVALIVFAAYQLDFGYTTTDSSNDLKIGIMPDSTPPPKSAAGQDSNLRTPNLTDAKQAEIRRKQIKPALEQAENITERRSIRFLSAARRVDERAGNLVSQLGKYVYVAPTPAPTPATPHRTTKRHRETSKEAEKANPAKPNPAKPNPAKPNPVNVKIEKVKQEADKEAELLNKGTALTGEASSDWYTQLTTQGENLKGELIKAHAARQNGRIIWMTCAGLHAVACVLAILVSIYVISLNSQLTWTVLRVLGVVVVLGSIGWVIFFDTTNLRYLPILDCFAVTDNHSFEHAMTLTVGLAKACHVAALLFVLAAMSVLVPSSKVNVQRAITDFQEADDELSQAQLDAVQAAAGVAAAQTALDEKKNQAGLTDADITETEQKLTESKTIVDTALTEQTAAEKALADVESNAAATPDEKEAAKTALSEKQKAYSDAMAEQKAAEDALAAKKALIKAEQDALDQQKIKEQAALEAKKSLTQKHAGLMLEREEIADYLAEEMNLLRLSLYVGMVLLIGDILQYNALLQWAGTYMTGPSEAIGGLMNSLAAFNASYDTALLAAIYLPCAFVLKEYALGIAPRFLPVDAQADAREAPTENNAESNAGTQTNPVSREARRDQWLQQRDLVSPNLFDQLKPLIALFGPIFFGMLSQQIFGWLNITDAPANAATTAGLSSGLGWGTVAAVMGGTAVGAAASRNRGESE
jgi:hypothetical protein